MHTFLSMNFSIFLIITVFLSLVLFFEGHKLYSGSFLCRVLVLCVLIWDTYHFLLFQANFCQNKVSIALFFHQNALLQWRSCKNWSWKFSKTKRVQFKTYVKMSWYWSFYREAVYQTKRKHHLKAEISIFWTMHDDSPTLKKQKLIHH